MQKFTVWYRVGDSQVTDVGHVFASTLTGATLLAIETLRSCFDDYTLVRVDFYRGEASERLDSRKHHTMTARVRE